MGMKFQWNLTRSMDLNIITEAVHFLKRILFHLKHSYASTVKLL